MSFVAYMDCSKLFLVSRVVSVTTMSVGNNCERWPWRMLVLSYVACHRERLHTAYDVRKSAEPTIAHSCKMAKWKTNDVVGAAKWTIGLVPCTSFLITYVPCAGVWSGMCTCSLLCLTSRIYDSMIATVTMSKTKISCSLLWSGICLVF